MYELTVQNTRKPEKCKLLAIKKKTIFAFDNWETEKSNLYILWITFNCTWPNRKLLPLKISIAKADSKEADQVEINILITKKLKKQSIRWKCYPADQSIYTS